jgi:hypothetical protein
MSNNTEDKLFRWFVMGWMSLSGVFLFLFMGLFFLGFDTDDIINNIWFIPPALLVLLIYSYVKHKDVLLKRLCIAFMIVGLPCLLLMFIAPMMMWV